MKRFLVVFLSLFFFLNLTACETVQETLITTQTSPDGQYTLSLYQIGDPVWSFGPVTAKLTVSNTGGEVLDDETLELANDGAGVDAGNIAAVSWSEHSVTVSMREADTTRQYTYVLEWE